MQCKVNANGVREEACPFESVAILVKSVGNILYSRREDEYLLLN